MSNEGTSSAPARGFQLACVLAMRSFISDARPWFGPMNLRWALGRPRMPSWSIGRDATPPSGRQKTTIHCIKFATFDRSDVYISEHNFDATIVTEHVSSPTFKTKADRFFVNVCYRKNIEAVFLKQGVSASLLASNPRPMWTLINIIH